MKRIFCMVLAVTMVVMSSFALAGTSTEKGVQAGAVCKFGHYPQTETGMDNTQVEWYVLKVDNGKALLISRKILACISYADDYWSTSWEESILRVYLNNYFYNCCFTGTEQQYIVKEDGDYVTLLTLNEVNTLLNSETRKTEMTAYIENLPKEMNFAPYTWWTKLEGTKTQTTVLHLDGTIVDPNSNYILLGDVDEAHGVRPVIWVQVDAIK